MRRGGCFVERIHRDRPEYAKLHGRRLLERRAAFRLGHVMGERRPRQRDAGALRLGRSRLRLRAADHGHLRLTARDALRGFVQISDRALATDWAVTAMRRLDAELGREQLL